MKERLIDRDIEMNKINCQKKLIENEENLTKKMKIYIIYDRMTTKNLDVSTT